mgnify:CR=1 FL=1
MNYIRENRGVGGEKEGREGKEGKIFPQKKKSGPEKLVQGKGGGQNKDEKDARKAFPPDKLTLHTNESKTGQNERTNERTNEQAKEQTKEQTNEQTNERTLSLRSVGSYQKLNMKLSFNLNRNPRPPR